MPPVPSRHSVSFMPLRRSPRIAAKANAKAATMPLVPSRHSVSLTPLRRSPRLEASKAKARADIEARTKARVAQLRPNKQTAEIITTCNALLMVLMSVHGRDAKAAAATTLMHYMATTGLQFTLSKTRFRSVIISKAYELKRDSQLHGGDHIEMVAACDRILAALNEPLVQQLRPEHMSRLELDSLINQLQKFRERAA
jgi:hypothetical protein